MILVCDERQDGERRACLALEYLSVFLFVVFLSFFTMVKRPEDLAEGTGADHLLMVIWKEGSGEQAFTHTEE